MKDPVCGMQVDPAKAAGTSEHQGQTHYFCSKGCKAKFDANPGHYVSPPVAPAAPPHSVSAHSASDVREYTCPMHPEVRQMGPGACPLCGMALEPVVASLEEDTTELDDMTRRFRWSLVVTVPILAFMISDFLPSQPLQHALAPAWMTWAQFLLATPVVLWGGWPFFVRGWASVVNRHLNMFTLIALGVGAAYGFSVFATFAPGWFPPSFRTHGDQIGVYFEPAAVIVVLVLLGQVLELRARSQTSSAIKTLLGLTPTIARRLDAAGVEQEVPLEHVQVGDTCACARGNACRSTASCWTASPTSMSRW